MDKVRIEEVQSTTKKQRIATHTHIKGLGLEASGRALPLAAGFVGQAEAREASGLVVDMIWQNLGTDMNCPHGIPVDLLDRLVIIRTQTYDVADMIKILALRANVEDLVIDDESLAYLGDIGLQASLRHAVQLLSPSSIMAKMNGRDNICKADIEEVKALYMDAKSSARLLQAQQEKYIS
ncbi:hypothetical protein CMV_025305 [Castanea mollissima]|uniref:RuvB-like helicase n=1 Tax=Castanea mollissima TaxID=60419 RepID=A0A8J4VH22_9ROSI|nr:hypothetical protein CMV_025305 [Castanea mollissima]